MDIMINSLYSNKDVFLRELVSNASDALDKCRLLAIQDASQYATGAELEVRVRGDAAGRTVVVEDSGVGMTRAELVSSLGTIARSGTAKFAEALAAGADADANLIGQFGVGFYSAFLVADRVTVTTKSNADERAWEWEAAAGAGGYAVREAAPEAAAGLPRGTRITLHLKEDAAEFATEAKLQALLRQYSEFVAFPVKLWSSRQEPVDVPDAEATAKAQAEADAAAAAAAAEGDAEAKAAPVQPVTKTEWVPREQWVTANDAKPLWTRSPKEVTGDEYAAFYTSAFKDFAPPLAHAHFSVEGAVEFTAMLFVPGMAPMDPAAEAAARRAKNVRLYVKRVFISDEFDEDLLPRWLTFVRGIVDSADLPLNVSREVLQESRVVRAIRKQLVRRSLDMLEEMAARPAEEGMEEGGGAYATFWEAFGRYVKLGVIEDADTRPRLAGLCRFASSASGAGLTSLAEYAARKKEGQSAIYYLCADSRAAAEASPYAEALAARGFEVLYLTEPIDEVAANNLPEFEGLKLEDVSREDLALGESDEDKAALAAKAEELKPLTDFMQRALGDKIEKVTVSARLTDSPAVVVASKFGWSATMEKVMRAQALGDARAAEFMRGRRALEVNPDHPVVKALAARVAAGEVAAAEEATRLLHDAAAMAGGFNVESPRDFAARVYKLMAADAPAA
jgi:heat shock protein beta